MEDELRREKKWCLISLFLFIILIIVICVHVYNRITLNNEYIECYANEKNHTTVINTLNSQLKQCRENIEEEREMCKEDISEIKIQREDLKTELEKFRSNSANCDVQLEYCKLHYRNCKLYYDDCKDQLQKEETKRENLEKTFNNATLECNKAKKLYEADIRSIKNKHKDCEIRAKGKEQCQEDLHKCNSKTCYFF